MSQKFAMDYIDVATRIAEFREKHPEGSLRPADPAIPYRIETIGDQVFIVVVAAAYRNPQDATPGIGMAYEQFPGKTRYTQGSELQNAETSAWGRAIVAALAADTKKGVASAEEVRNRSADAEETVPPTVATSPESEADQLRRRIAAVGDQGGYQRADVAALFEARIKKDIRQAGMAELAEFLAWFRKQPGQRPEAA